MASTPPPYPPPGPYGYDPREQRRFMRDQARAQRATYRAQARAMRYQMRGMRRSSILGPLVLIVLGIVILLVQTGRLDHAHVWLWYGQWWPVLLVGAGLIVLVEWMVDQRMMRDPRRPQYRRSFGGGIFLLVVLFIGAGLAAHGFHEFATGGRIFPGFQFDQNSLDHLFGDKHESYQTLEEDFAADGSLSVSNPRGDVTVSGTSADGRLHIAMHKVVYARTDSDALTKAQELVPAVTNDGSLFSMRMPAQDGARTDLVLQVPATASVNVIANSGDVRIASIQNAVQLTANHGNVDLSAITGPTTVRVNNGGKSVSARSLKGGLAIQGHAQDITLNDITGAVTLTGDFFGTTHLERINGAVHVHTTRTDLQLVRLDGEMEIHGPNVSVDQAMGPLVLHVGNRMVTLDRIAGDIAVTDHNGSIDLIAAPTMGNISIENRHGAVNVSLPENAGFSLDATTSDGDVSTDYPLTTSDLGRSKTLTGTVGAGGSMVRIATSYGNISLNKTNVAPIPAVLPPAPKITLANPGVKRSGHKPRQALIP